MKRWLLSCRRVLLALGLSPYAVAACSSSGNTIEETRDFSDDQGRNCQAKLKRTSLHAPAVSDSVSCDSPSKQCSSEASPCFELSVADKANHYTLRNCPACCSGTASSFVSADCSPVVCSADTDCVFGLAQCQNGTCSCPDGVCD
jgi:hypothetical protein